MRLPPRIFPAFNLTLTLLGFLTCLGIQSAAAQNDLRQGISSKGGSSQFDLATERFQPTANPSSHLDQHNSVPVTAPPMGSGAQVHRDPALTPAVHARNLATSGGAIERTSNLEPMSQVLGQIRNESTTPTMSGRRQLDVPDRDEMTDWHTFPPLSRDEPEASTQPTTTEAGSNVTESPVSQESLQDLVKQLGFSTLFVLFFGVGFIVIAKLWTSFNSKATQPTTPSNQFEVVTELKLAGKSCLTLVEVDSQRLVIAADPTGIKSVVPLSESFANRLAAFEPDGEPQQPFADRLSASTTDSASDDPTDTGVEPKDMTYSLGTIGKPRQSQSAESKTRQQVQSEMEAALTESGLKELILKSLREAS